MLRKFDESKHPRHPAGSSEGGEFAPAGGAGEGAPTQQLVAARAVADRIATEMHFDPDRIDVVDQEPREFEVAGQKLHEGGHYNPRTGRIQVNVRELGEGSFTPGLVTHEILHAQEDTLHRVSQAEHDEIRAHFRSGTTVGQKDRLFSVSGFPRDNRIAEIEARWPASATLAKYHPQGDSYLGAWKQDASGHWKFDDTEYTTRLNVMKEEDGASAYSRLYWQRDAASGHGYSSSSIGETAAETARYQHQAPKARWHERDTSGKPTVPSKRWQAYTNAIKTIYPKIKHLDWSDE